MFIAALLKFPRGRENPEGHQLMSRLPFKVSGVSAKVMNESRSNNVKTDPDYGYEIDDSLLEMAGLK